MGCNASYDDDYKWKIYMISKNLLKELKEFKQIFRYSWPLKAPLKTKLSSSEIQFNVTFSTN